ncbi:MAG: PE-PPE domain-containing protein [Mycobacteriaceae bacterium]|nr:PE-PPE domain-containing protein [Mycobacteriaceae bacterium]
MTITVYELGGTHRISFFDLGGTPTPATSYFNLGLNSNFRWQWVEYPAQALPMGPSVASGKANLISAINATPGQFVLLGTSQGAIVTSQVYNEIRFGSLASRRSDFLYGATFGNPMRQRGHTFPGCPDPGGHGIFGTRLADTEELWWDFATPGDPACTTGDDLTGLWATALFDAVYTNYDGTAETLLEMVIAHPNPLLNVQQILSVIVNLFYGVFAPDAPHQSYGTVSPLPGDTRPSMRIALDHINSLAPESAPAAVVPPWFTGAPVSVTGWWPILYGDFSLTLSPQLGMIGAANTFALTLTPTIGVAAKSRKDTSFALTVAPAVAVTGMGTPGTSTTRLEFRLTPTIGVIAAQLKTFGLVLNPALGMRAVVNSVALTLNPTFTMGAAPRWASAFSCTLTPAFGATAQLQTGTSTASFGLALYPALRITAAPNLFRLTLTPVFAISGQPKHSAGFGLALAPTVAATTSPKSVAVFGLTLNPVIGAGGAATSTASFGLRLAPQLAIATLRSTFALALTPQLGAQAAYVGSFGLNVTPQLQVTGVGSTYYDATGTGNTSTPASTTGSLSWTQDITAGAKALIFVAVNSGGSTVTFPTATLGGAALTELDRVWANNSAGSVLLVAFKIDNPSSGTQTVNITANGSATIARMVGNSMSMRNAGSFGTAVKTFGPGSSLSVSATAPLGGMVAGCLGWGTASYTGYNQTQKFFHSNVAVILGGIAAGTGAPVAFSCTASSWWSGIAVPITP